jgi:hypothetical protein
MKKAKTKAEKSASQRLSDAERKRMVRYLIESGLQRELPFGEEPAKEPPKSRKRTRHAYPR